MIVFLGLLENNVTAIFYCLIDHLKILELNLCKFVAFGSNNISIMMGFHSGVATRLKIY